MADHIKTSCEASQAMHYYTTCTLNFNRINFEIIILKHHFLRTSLIHFVNKMFVNKVGVHIGILPKIQHKLHHTEIDVLGNRLLLLRDRQGINSRKKDNIKQSDTGEKS